MDGSLTGKGKEAFVARWRGYFAGLADCTRENTGKVWDDSAICTTPT